MEEKIYRIDAERLEGLKKFISEAFVLPSDRPNIEITFTPHIYLVPVYTYTRSIISFVRAVFGRRLKFKREGTIDFGYLSMFRPVKPSKRLVKFYFYLKLGESRHWITRIRAEEIYRSFDYELVCNSTGRFLAREWIEAIQKVLGDNYYNYDGKVSSYVYYALQRIEKEMFIAATLFYSLYTGEYEAENLPVEWANLLRGYGDNFDEVVESINLASILLRF